MGLHQEGLYQEGRHAVPIRYSNTLYTNTVADITSLLAAASEIVPITNPSTAIFQATETAFAMSGANNYLYLVWDFRNVTQDQLCYSASSADEAWYI